MKLIDVVVAMIILCAFALSSTAFVQRYVSLYRKNSQAEYVLSTNVFLTRSFERDCLGNNGSIQNLEQWRNMCLPLLQLDELNVRAAKDDYVITWQKNDRIISIQINGER